MIIIHPGAVLASKKYTWTINDAPPGAEWTMSIRYTNGVGMGISLTGVIDGTGSVTRTIDPPSVGEYEVRFVVGDEYRYAPLRSIANWEFIWRPDYSARASKEPKVKRIQFGDGYAQDYATGINNNLVAWDVQFSDLPTVIAMQIELFLDTMAGHTAFSWKDANGTMKKYLCKSYSRSPVDEDTESVTARFEQVIL